MDDEHFAYYYEALTGHPNDDSSSSTSVKLTPAVLESKPMCRVAAPEPFDPASVVKLTSLVSEPKPMCRVAAPEPFDPASVVKLTSPLAKSVAVALKSTRIMSTIPQEPATAPSAKPTSPVLVPDASGGAPAAKPAPLEAELKPTSVTTKKPPHPSQPVPPPSAGELKHQATNSNVATEMISTETFVLGMLGCHLGINRVWFFTGEGRLKFRWQAKSSKKVKVLLEFCLRSHHLDALPPMFKRHRKYSGDRGAIAKSVDAATKGRLEFKQLAQGVWRFSHPVFLDDSVIDIAREAFPDLDPKILEAARVRR